MNLKEAHTRYGWPSEAAVLQPSGGGPAHFATIANAKIGGALSRVVKSESGPTAVIVRTGLLCANPDSDRTEAPVAVVCEFNRHVDVATLREAHRLAWNFSHAPLLITLEPSRVFVWSCSVRPSTAEEDLGMLLSSTSGLSDKIISCEITRPDDPLSDLSKPKTAETEAIDALSWINLLAGRHFHLRPDAFKAAGRLDTVLIKNLMHARSHLHTQLGLAEKRCHDLLARLIFIQFLFQRKDSMGRAALHPERLRDLSKSGVLDKVHAGLPELLADYEDSYRFFVWLNDRFNGDLFPGKGATSEDREQEWKEEMAEVRPKHLEYLARFISAKEDLTRGQGLLWQHYAFDVIPLELISSIYELFVGPAKKDKAYYTRSHLVDFMLDAVLPWRGERSDLKILDPSCGSGIFLVKAFQRLVHRWKQKHGNDPKPLELRTLLQNQLFGTDINSEAIRVASFSLYLALCDELDPRHYWTRDKLFPRLRDHNLIARDFFADETPVHSGTDAGFFDLIIGNAPWGKSSAKDGRSGAVQWARDHGWTVPGRDHGSVFLAKAACLTKPDGWVSMIQPGGLLLNRMGPAQKFRKKLFTMYTFEEVINLAAIRRELFAKAIGASCVVTFQPKPPRPGADFAYVTPKPQSSVEDGIRILIEPHDIHFLTQKEASSDDLVWSVLMWGGRRDLELIRRLSKGETIGKLINSGRLATREGVIRGNRGKIQEVIDGRKFLSDTEFPSGTFLEFEAESLTTNRDTETDRGASVNFTAFEPPQLIFKQSWRSELGRFEAALVIPDASGRGALCSDSYVSIRDLEGSDDLLAGLWLLLKSQMSPYWFTLTGAQFAGFIPKATEAELRQLPVLLFPNSKLRVLAQGGYRGIDETAFELLALTEADRILVEDLHDVVLPDAQRQGGAPPGYKPVSVPELESYAETFIRVLRANGDNGRGFSSTIYTSRSTEALPVQLIAFHFGWKDRTPIIIQPIKTPELRDILQKCHDQILSRRAEGVAYQRVIEVASTVQSDCGPVPTLYLVKPSHRRYWLRSLAMRDADRLGGVIENLLISNK